MSGNLAAIQRLKNTPYTADTGTKGYRKRECYNQRLRPKTHAQANRINQKAPTSARVHGFPFSDVQPRRGEPYWRVDVLRGRKRLTV